MSVTRATEPLEVQRDRYARMTWNVVDADGIAWATGAMSPEDAGEALERIRREQAARDAAAGAVAVTAADNERAKTHLSRLGVNPATIQHLERYAGDDGMSLRDFARYVLSTYCGTRAMRDLPEV